MPNVSVCRKLFVACAAAGILLAGCSRTTSMAFLSSSPAATGITGKLPKLTGAPKWNIEMMGAVPEPWKKTIFQMPGRGKVKVIGWAVDQVAQLPAGGVELAIDGTPYAAQYGMQRKDVATAFGISSYDGSGYSFELDADRFSPGKHNLFFRVLSNDKSRYWEVGPYTLELN